MLISILIEEYEYNDVYQEINHNKTYCSGELQEKKRVDTHNYIDISLTPQLFGFNVGDKSVSVISFGLTQARAWISAKREIWWQCCEDTWGGDTENYTDTGFVEQSSKVMPRLFYRGTAFGLNIPGLWIRQDSKQYIMKSVQTWDCNGSCYWE